MRRFVAPASEACACADARPAVGWAGVGEGQSAAAACRTGRMADSRRPARPSPSRPSSSTTGRSRGTWRRSVRKGCARWHGITSICPPIGRPPLGWGRAGESRSCLSWLPVRCTRPGTNSASAPTASGWWTMSRRISSASPASTPEDRQEFISVRPGRAETGFVSHPDVCLHRGKHGLPPRAHPGLIHEPIESRHHHVPCRFTGEMSDVEGGVELQLRRRDVVWPCRRCWMPALISCSGVFPECVGRGAQEEDWPTLPGRQTLPGARPQAPELTDPVGRRRCPGKSCRPRKSRVGVIGRGACRC